jgi:23S rRNA (uracil1939-C5)-methyltransferase
LELAIEKLVYGGEGLSRLPANEHGPGKAVFLPFVLPGERITASLIEEKSGFARARLETVLQPSPDRIAPACPYFQRCGGCHYQHTSYDHQLQIKAEILKENLRRTAKLELNVPLQVHPSPPWNYRNRTRLKVQTAPEFALGYYRFASHELLPIAQCPISSPLLNRAIEAIYAFARHNPAPTGMQELELFANAEDAELCLEIYCSVAAAIPEATSWAERLQANFPAIAGAAIFQQSPEKHEPFLAASLGASQLTYRQQSIAYKVSAGAFFQVNRHLIGALTDIVTSNVAGKTALDLYAGVGLFSTRLAASFAQVIAVDSSPTSHSDLRYNSPPNVKVVRATAEQYLAKQQQQHKKNTAPPDLLVVDPPRSGLGERVVNSLVKLAPYRIAYVSCDPATLARDLRHLLTSGYRIEHAHLVDLFPQTYHLESVFHLAR